MATLKKTVKDYKDAIQLTITLVTVVVALTGAFIVYKLAPLVSRIDKVEAKVILLEDTEIVTKNEWELRIDEVNSRLDRIENKIDRIIER